jgi:hypothetical protein
MKSLLLGISRIFGEKVGHEVSLGDGSVGDGMADFYFRLVRGAGDA